MESGNDAGENDSYSQKNHSVDHKSISRSRVNSREASLEAPDTRMGGNGSSWQERDDSDPRLDHDSNRVDNMIRTLHSSIGKIDTQSDYTSRRGHARNLSRTSIDDERSRISAAMTEERLQEEKKDADQEALEHGMLVSQQESQFGINMYDSLTADDNYEIDRLIDLGYTKEQAVLLIFERKYGKVNRGQNHLQSLVSSPQIRSIIFTDSNFFSYLCAAHFHTRDHHIL